MLSLLLACGGPAEEPALPPAVQQAMAQDLPDDLATGRVAFREQCAACHGLNGDGDGPAAAALDDDPAALAIGERDAARLEHTIRHGVSGTAMQGYDDLDDAVITAMAAWLAARTPGTREPPG